ncbi:hypothetical protein [Sorangium sp. So ce1000]|uniref:hypothetical protein n=1 Tax=Sorangium sp. So ce1000 TaxID=3133325 RepID=UPI003F5EADC3
MKTSISTPSALVPQDPLEAFGAALASVIAERVASIVAARAQTAAPPTEPLVTIHELSAALRLSEAKIRRMVREGCPVEYYGGSQRFDVAAVRAWAQARGKQRAAQPRKEPVVMTGPIPGVELKTRKGRG